MCGHVEFIVVKSLGCLAVFSNFDIVLIKVNILLFYRLKENPISEIFDNYAFIFLLEFHDFEVLFDLKKFLLFISRHFPLDLSI